jgi:hypothetical protein
MGDRAVFGFRAYENDPIVFLYSHWGGASQESDLAEALAFASPRLNDGSYGTRMMLTHLTRDAGLGDTGYGIYAGTETTPHAGDYSYMYLVDFPKGKVLKVNQRDITDVLGEVRFDEFLRNPFLLSEDEVLSGLLA